MLFQNVKGQKAIIKKTYEILRQAGGIPLKDAVYYPLDVYRRYLEAISHFIEVLRIMIELLNGQVNPKSHKPYVDNCEIIRKIPLYAPLVSSIDPILRHSESHLNTSFDEKSQTIIIKSKRKKGNPVIVTYTLTELQNKLIDLDKNLMPALVVTFTLQEYAMVLRVLESPEYLQTIFGIGNRT